MVHLMKVQKQTETLGIYGAIYSNNTVNPLGFIIVKAGQEGSRSGLQINQYGKVLNFYSKVSSDNIQINPTADGYDDGLRISRADPTSTGNSSIQLGCSRTSTVGAIDGQWSIFTPPSSSTNNPQCFVIAVSSQAGDNNRDYQLQLMETQQLSKGEFFEKIIKKITRIFCII
ncbi:MAG: hypothetical protein EZS28_028523 [Streblomastix strix]|uniref:Uncharacterized protein n=1 Tax=Streblomastix strix TaxID=222440 RepID=A0A5J4V1N0_9EUKA|nr:MAG: hypothetical protein EZS28_028523 [Streblomastix strix]